MVTGPGVERRVLIVTVFLLCTLDETLKRGELFGELNGDGLLDLHGQGVGNGGLPAQGRAVGMGTRHPPAPQAEIAVGGAGFPPGAIINAFAGRRRKAATKQETMKQEGRKQTNKQTNRQTDRQTDR